MKASSQLRELLGVLTDCGVEDPTPVLFARDALAGFAQRGTVALPEFTLHGVTHSDNVAFLLREILRQASGDLTCYEARLLFISAYLHDLGMFSSPARWTEQVYPERVSKLAFCPERECDDSEAYDMRGAGVAKQIRSYHHLLSSYWLMDNPGQFLMDIDDLPYMIPLCRGHRKANLASGKCSCFETKSVDGQQLRLGLLASLLRVADALDYFQNRAPRRTLEHCALDFMSKPEALSHWLVHYFVSDPEVVIETSSRTRRLQAIVHFTVPAKQLNGVAYSDFFRPLFDEHINSLRQGDFSRAAYPPEFFSFLDVSDLRAEAAVDAMPGFRELPTDISCAIDDCGADSIGGFLAALERRWPAFSALAIAEERTTEMLHGISGALQGVLLDAEYLQSLAEAEPPEGNAILQAVTRLRENTQYATSVVHGFRELMRQDYRTGWDGGTQDLWALVDAVARSMAEYGKSNDVSVEVQDLQRMRGVTYDVDPEALRHALRNVLHNAVTYAYPESSVTIELGEHGGQPAILVSNEGFGIDESELPHLFSAGFRGSNARSLRPTGTGIGLYVAREMLRRCGGNVMLIKSDPRSRSGGSRNVFGLALGGDCGGD